MPLPPWPDRGSRRPRHNHGGGRRHRDRPSRARRAFGSRGVIRTYGSTTYIAASGASVDERFDGDIYAHEPMSRHTAYRLGGPARFYVRVASVGALTRLVDVCESRAFHGLWSGAGRTCSSPTRFSRRRHLSRTGFPQHARRRRVASFHGGCRRAALRLVQEAFRRSLAGLEFAVGTPGTIGGALRMNADRVTSGSAPGV